MATRYQFQPRRPSELGLEAETLLSRYPELRPNELQALIEIFPRLPHIDVALMSADTRLAKKVSAFRDAHEDDLKMPIATRIGFAIAFGLIPIAMVIGLGWWVM